MVFRESVAEMTPDTRLLFFIKDTHFYCWRIFRNENKCGVEPELWNKICDFNEDAGFQPAISLEQVQSVRTKINSWLRGEFNRQVANWKNEFYTSHPYTLSLLNKAN